ncbi:MAG TPA: right-handed parallel beta-helix repeat-containing protein [Anaerolineales bacterium]|nr:right-handed parallel beta-helix repeat-containing protein [Anaerolineales bacterium]
MNKTIRSSTFAMTFVLALVFAATSTLPVLADGGMIPSTEAPPRGPTSIRSAPSSSKNIAQVPSGAKIVVVDNEGNKVPLGSQQATAIVNSGDPMWCPDGILPVAGNGGCTVSYTGFASLLADLSAINAGTGVDANGTIWFEDSYVSSINDPGVSSFTLDGAALTTWAGYSLTLQGGWTGDSSGTISPSGPSQFNGPLNIVNWKGDVILDNLLVTKANGPGMNVTLTGIGPSANGAGLAITTTGTVRLSNVDSIGNLSNGLLIDNRSGPGSVSIDGGNFSDNGQGVMGGLGLYVHSNGAISLNNVTANDNRWAGALLFNDDAGANGPITLTGTNVFSGNSDYGAEISSNGNIWISNLTADKNLHGAYIYNAGGIENVTFSGNNEFNDNFGEGVYVASDGVITLHNVTAEDNGEEGALLLNGLRATSSKIVLTGTNVFQGNGGAYPDWYYDLYIGLNNNVAQYRNVTTYGDFVLQSLSSDQLPAGLPTDTTFISALQVVQGAPIGDVVVSFLVPPDKQNADFSILYWDNTQWRDLSSANFDDGRTVIDPGHLTNNGYFEATVDFGGIFVLVEK